MYLLSLYADHPQLSHCHGNSLSPPAACMYVRVSPDREISSILSWEWGPDGAARAGHAIYPLRVAFRRITLSSELMGNSMGEQTGHISEPASLSNTYGSIYTYQNVICDQICFVGKRPIQSHFLRLCLHEILFPVLRNLIFVQVNMFADEVYNRSLHVFTSVCGVLPVTQEVG